MSRTDASYSAQQVRDFGESLRRMAKDGPVLSLTITRDRAVRMADHIQTMHAEFARLSRIAKAGRGLRDALEELVDALKDEVTE